ncbi:Lrp/AsnC family transcriptional regulator [Halobacterium yunchengense]|uniref:Lrp/AsnC family transcriptional regulator n=1 Tax=Halobacterium yunchengense TaxID=3108497 RepID=UPI0030092156
MVTAYVLVKANTGEADRLLEDVAAIDGVVDAHIVAGDVDLIAKLDVDAPTDVKEIAADRIQTVDGVESTETYISM